MSRIVYFETGQHEFTIDEFESILKSAKQEGATNIDMIAFEGGDFELQFYAETPKVELVGEPFVRELMIKYMPRHYEKHN